MLHAGRVRHCADPAHLTPSPLPFFLPPAAAGGAKRLGGGAAAAADCCLPPPPAPPLPGCCRCCCCAAAFGTSSAAFSAFTCCFCLRFCRLERAGEAVTRSACACAAWGSAARGAASAASALNDFLCFCLRRLARAPLLASGLPISRNGQKLLALERRDIECTRVQKGNDVGASRPGTCMQSAERESGGAGASPHRQPAPARLDLRTMLSQRQRVLGRGEACGSHEVEKSTEEYRQG